MYDGIQPPLSRKGYALRDAVRVCRRAGLTRMAEPLHCDRPAHAKHAELYELLVSELTEFAVFLTDAEGCITSWNPGVERLLGFKQNEWVGQPADMIFTPEDRAAKKPEEEMAIAIRDGRAPDQRWHQRKDG